MIIEERESQFETTTVLVVDNRGDVCFVGSSSVTVLEIRRKEEEKERSKWGIKYFEYFMH